MDATWLIPALPLFGFLTLVAFGRRMGEPLAGWFATLMVAGSFAASVVVWLDLESTAERSFTQTLFTWLPAGGFSVDVGFLVDPLSITMCLFITGVSALIHLYSIGYMHGDEKFSKFFVYMNLFVFSMLVLVLSDNLLLTFLGWEGVGTCSYLLISFWHTSEVNATAGKKAFVTNRIGDWGFMVAMFLCFFALGSLSYIDIFAGAGGLATTTATALAVLLFIGAVGKSAQLPLLVWLPDAMAGPTPVSALIHAATMVTAGVYLMTRMNPVLAAASPWVSTMIACVGAATALFAATIALAQNDIKRVLAYSTVSQLGYMFLAVGCGAYVAAIFLMITHAFFKALLFLGAGSVIHGMGDEQDMRRMGGLRKLMPITAFTFIIGWLAIAGVPPFAGFWAKDEVLLSAWHKGGGTGQALWAVGLVTAFLTAFYMSRQVFLTFYGEPRWKQASDATDDHDEIHPHESTWSMTVPLVVLAGLAVVGGVLHLPFLDRLKTLEHWLEPVVEPGEVHVTVTSGTKIALAAVATAVCLLGVLVAVVLYLRRRFEDRPADPEVLARGWYYDSAISAFVGGPGRKGFDGLAWFDRTVVDGSVNGVAALVRGGGNTVRRLQSGYVRNYALGVAFGAIVLVGALVLRGCAVSAPILAAEAGTGFPLLTIAVALPAVGAVATALVSRRRPESSRLVATMFAVATGAVTVAILVAFETSDAGFQMTEKYTWIRSLDISWYLGVDGISLFLVVLTGLLFPLAMLGAPPHHDDKAFHAWLLLLEAGCIGTFLALDLFLFFVMFEIVLVPMYFLISGWGYANRRYAAMKFFLYTMLGSAFMLVGLVATAVLHAQGSGSRITFNLVTIASDQGAIAEVTARWLFVAFAVAFAVKVPLFPLHTWLPDAHTEAPTAGSVILAGVMLKLGTYGFLRYGLYLFPEASVYFAPALLTLGVVGVLYGAVVATMQRDLKRLVAYSSIAHLGFIILGTFSLTTQGLQGSVLQMVNHGISTGALFLLVGMIYERRHTRAIAQLKGLQKSAPVMAGVFTVVMLSSIAVPGLNGFVGEFMILLGTFLTRRWWAVVAATGVILAAVYLLWAYQRVFHGEPDDDNTGFADMRLTEGLVMAPLVGLIVFLGIYPRPVLDRIEPAVSALVTHVEDDSDYIEPSIGVEGKAAREDTYTEGEAVREEHRAEVEAEAEGD